MKVDIYNSRAKPLYCLLVPAGASFDRFAEDLSTGVEAMLPLTLHMSSVGLKSLAHDKLFCDLKSQLDVQGAAVMKVADFSITV